MPRLLSLGLAYLQWAWFEQHLDWVAERPEPIGLIGVVGVAWLFGLRWGLPRPRVPWEAGPVLSFLGPQLLHAAFLSAFGGLRLWQDWELPAALSSWIGLLPYLVIQHAFRYGEAGLAGLDGVRAAAFAQRQSVGLLAGILPVALVSQLGAWGTMGLPADPAAWTGAEQVRGLIVELASLALAFPLVLVLLPRLLGATQGLPALQAAVDGMWRGAGPAPRTLHWSTEGLVANAVAVGFGPWKRILVSDALQARLEPHQLEAVLSHELAHFERRHAAALVAGTAGALLLAVAALELLLPTSEEEPSMAWLLLALAPAALPFLYASRRFEQQADLDAIERSPVYAGGLTGALSLLMRRRPRFALRHPAVGRRIEEIRLCLTDPARAERHHGRAERARRLLWALFVAGLAGLLAATLGADLSP